MEPTRDFLYQIGDTKPDGWQAICFDTPQPIAAAAKYVAVYRGAYGKPIHVAEAKPSNLHSNGAPFCVRQYVIELVT